MTGIPPPFRIYACEEWGAHPPRHAATRTRPTALVLHHMASPNRSPVVEAVAAREKAFAVARRCQADHLANGWADTGQHFTITREGVVLEGRHGSLAAALAGQCVLAAHAADPDTDAFENESWGTEHEGTYSTEAMPPAQWEASVKLQAWLALQCGLDTATIKGHRDTGCRTACPGDWFHAQLGRLRHEAHELKKAMLARHLAGPAPVDRSFDRAGHPETPSPS